MQPITTFSDYIKEDFKPKPASKSFSIRQMVNKGTYRRYHAFLDGKVIAEVELYLDRPIEILSMYIADPDLRNKGYGTKILAAIKKRVIDKYQGRTIKADCLSKQSLSMMVKVFGTPTMMMDMFASYDTVEAAMKALPNESTVVDGEIIGGSSDAMYVEFKNNVED